MNLQLTIESGDGRGMTWTIDKTPLQIGRARNCDIVIADPSVSRRHCRINCDGNSVWLEDLDSSNAVMVNGNPVDRCELFLGDRVVIGRTEFRVTANGPGGPIIDSALASQVTASLSANEPLFVREDLAAIINGARPGTVQDLAMLFQFSRTLSQTLGYKDTLAAILASVKNRLEPDSAWVIVLDEDGEMRFIEPDATQYSPYHASLGKMAILKHRGLVTARRSPSGGIRDIRTVMVAPAITGGKIAIMLVVEALSKNRVYDETDLVVLMSIAQIAAPYIRYAERVEELQVEIEDLREYSGKGHSLIGSSPSIERVRTIIRQIAPSRVSVLLLGETGTGKELAAAMIHELSDRADRAFITVNCAAIPAELFESEMFGYERGAFTGASRRKLGHFELADGGTLFLDEIGDLSPISQARILRALESGTFHRIGGVEPISVDVRVVSATNRDLVAEVGRGAFRSDLFHRICGVDIHMPSLRSRIEDVQTLAQYFLSRFSGDANRRIRGFSSEALGYLESLSWPGNVRELRMLVQRAVYLGNGEWLELRDLLPESPTTQISGKEDSVLTIREVERIHIAQVLRKCKGNISAAAKLLDIHRNTLYAKIEEYDL